MSLRSLVALALAAAALALPAGALARGYSTGTPEQIAWVRRAASNFVIAELAHNGEAACGILNAPLRATRRRRTCAQRMDRRLTTLLRTPGARARLRVQRRAILSAVVSVRGNVATLALATPLIGGANRFLWTENCWMLMG